MMLCWGAADHRARRAWRCCRGFAGLLVAAPVIGHASWHAYRAGGGG
ncbi:MAG: hypothetical protein MZW92_49020 [Comamonadaceae bacterium]|nr:hypothetical protein [Comamonadaceae bacterium]